VSAQLYPARMAAAGSEKEGYRISQEFVTAMVEEFRQQRKIHLRFAFQIVMDILAQLQTLPTLVDITIPEGASFTVCGVSLEFAFLIAVHTTVRKRVHLDSSSLARCHALAYV